MDPTQQEATPQVKVTGQELIAYGPSSLGALKIPAEALPKELQTASQKAMDLKKRREKQMTATEILQESVPQKEITFLPTEFDAMKLAFGAGHAEKQNNQIVPKTDGLLPEDKAMVVAQFERGRVVVERQQALLTYTQVLQEAQQRKVNADQIAREKGLQPDKYKAMKESALDQILATQVLWQLMPELSKMGRAEQRLVAETFIANDPQLRRVIADKLQEQMKSLRALEPVKEDEDYKKAKEAKKVQQARLEQGVVQAARTLVNEGLGFDESSLASALYAFMDRGLTPESALTTIRQQVISQDTDLKIIEDIENLEKDKSAKNKELGTYKTSTNQAAAQRLDQEIKDIEAEIPKLRLKLSNKDSSFERQKKAELDFLRKITSSDKVTGTGEYAQPAAQLLREARQAKMERDTATATAEQHKQKAEQAERLSRNDRLEKESEILSEMEVNVATAVHQTLLARLEQLKTAEQERMSDVIKKAENESVTKVGKKMQENWAHLDERTRSMKINYRQLGNDLRYLAYHSKDNFSDPEEPVKRLLLRDLGKADYRTVDLSKLSDEEKAALEKTYTTLGASYKKELFDDYLLARTNAISPEHKHLLNLKQHEIDAVNAYFQEDLQSAIEASPLAKSLKEQLKLLGFELTGWRRMALYLVAILSGVGLGSAAGSLLATVAPSAISPAAVTALSGAVGGGVGYVAADAIDNEYDKPQF